MMKRLKAKLKKLARKAARVARRFLANDPRTTYERIAFSAVREAAHHFGKAAIA